MEIIPPSFDAYFEYQSLKQAKHIALHVHEGFEFLYITRGATTIYTRGKKYLASAGDLVICSPGEAHEEHVSAGQYDQLCLRFHPSKLDTKIPIPAPGELEPVLNLPFKERFRVLFEQIAVEHKGVDRFSQVLVGSYLVQFVALLWRALSVKREEAGHLESENDYRIGALIDIINQRVDLDHSVADLAGKVYLSESRLQHVFKSAIGISPKKYQIKARMEKAGELLGHSNESISEIARILGYEDPAYFNRLFKQQWGSTPTQFRFRAKKVL